MSSLPKPSVHGPTGHSFEMSLPGKVRIDTFSDSGARIPQYGVGVLFDRTYISGNGTSPTVHVSIMTLTNVVPARRLRPFLRSYLPSTHGGRIIKWKGHTAATGFLAPSCSPDGPCSGEEGSLIVIDGTTLFNVVTEQNTLASAIASLNTFRLQN
jgi:hypothetical protein